MIQRLIALLTISLMTFISTAQEDNITWSAYLFDNINYDLIRVNADGSTTPYSFDLAENDYLSITETTISNDGRLVAFCKQSQSTGTNDQVNPKTFIIREIETGTTLVETTYDNVHACAATGFSDDDSQVALSLVHYQAFDAVPEGESLWSLRLIDVATGDLNLMLQERDAIMPEYDLFGEDVPLLAMVQEFSMDGIRFNAIPWVGMGGPSHVPSYFWSFAENSVTELNIEFGRVSNDYLSTTGELVYPYFDQSQPAAIPEGPVPQANQVQIMTADGNSATIYQIEDWIILSTTFINNGEQIAVMLSGFVMGADSEIINNVRLDIVNRDGTVQTIDYAFDGGLWLDQAGSGTLIVYTPNPTTGELNSTQLLYWDGTALNPLGDYLPNYSAGFSPPQLIWVSPTTVSPELPAFTPIN